MCTVLLIPIHSCERDDQDTRATTLPLAQSSSTITTVSSKEIPEVMEYVQSITPKTGKFAVQSENNGVRSSEPDLVLGELQLDEINTVTDENAKTNYTFRLKTIETNYEGFVSHFNLVIKETTSGLYSYIVEYRMMDYWYSTQRRGIDLNNYNGHFVYYQSNGTYFGKVDFIDGAIIDVQQKICDNPPDNDTGGGGDGNNGDTGNTGDTGNSDSGDSGNGGYDITITTQCCYGVHSDSSAPGCQCADLPDIIIIEMNFADPTNDSKDKSFYRNLRNPCPSDEHCASENDCEYGWNDDCSCAEENPEVGVVIRLDILFEIRELVEENTFALIDINCDQIENWQELAQHTAPEIVQSKIDNLPNGTFNDFEIQSLQDAGGTTVNLDYFSVKITSLPINPNTNQQFTAEQFQNYFRLNINDFVENSTFEPFCEVSSICQQETNLWNSTNPLGALVYIDIPLDDGAVICTEYTNTNWYFMTMNAPFAGNHPVSGTRQFGYETNADGSINFFVRGVDRFDSNLVENMAWLSDSFNDFNAFQGADDLWESFQNKINDFVNTNGGTSSINNPIKNRPDWEEVQEVLEGDRPLSDLGCN